MDRKASPGFIAAALTAVCLLATSAEAAQSKCLAGKNKCMSKKAGSLLKCHQKAETPNKPSDPNFGGCLDKARAKFDGTPDPTKGCFEKLENKSPNDCITFNDTMSAEIVVDDCVDQIVAAIDPGPVVTQSKCGVGKKKCAAKKLKSILKCYQKAQTPGKPANPNANDCITKAMAKFDGGTVPANGCFEKLENKTGNDCQPPLDNQAAVEGIIDSSCVAAFVAILENPTTTSTTTTSTSTTTTSTTTSTTSTTTTTTAPTTTTTTTSSTTTTAPTTTTTTTTTSTTTTTTTTTSTTTSSTTSTTTTTTSTTTTTTGGLTIFDFTTGAGVGVCGTATNAAMAVVKNLTCGGLNIGGGGGTAPEGVVPDGSVVRSALSCTGPNCTIGPNSTVPPVNSAAPDCSNTGCAFGTPLSLPNPTITIVSACVVNTWSAPASGSLNLATGATTLAVPLSSDIFTFSITASNPVPCPRCVTAPNVPAAGTPSSPATGTCDRGVRGGLACTSTSSTGFTRDCLPGGVNATSPCTVGGGVCADGSLHIGPLTVSLTPLTSGNSTATADAAGKFCGPSQPQAGCFRQPTCRNIFANGSSPGPLTPGVPASGTLSSIFCIPATASGVVNAQASLPGPGEVTLPGTWRVQ